MTAEQRRIHVGNRIASALPAALQTVALVLLLTVALPAAAHAYLDPGTGSMVLQGIVAAVAGGLLVLKTYWRRIRSYFRKEEPAPTSESE